MRSSTRRTAISTLGVIALLGCQPGADQELVSATNERIQHRGEGKDNWYDALPRPAWSKFTPVEQSQEWFEVYEILPGVLAIYEPGQFEEVISYLIVGSANALLFDTGLGIGDIANAQGRPHEQVKEFVGEGWIWKPLPPGFSAADYSSEPFTITKNVIGHEKIRLGGRTLEVIATPGHSPDSLCLLDRENRLLFVGDTFYPASLYAHLPGSDFEQYAETAARLAALQPEVDYILPAHNEPLLDSAYLTRFRDAFRAMKDEKTAFVLTDGSREYGFEGFSILVPDPPPWSQGR